MTPRSNASPSSFARAVGQHVRPLLAALILCALPISSDAFPQPTVEKAPAEPQPLFQESAEAIRLAKLGMGVSFDRTGGPFGLMSILVAGQNPEMSAWTLQGVMGTPVERARFGTVTLLGSPAMPAGPLCTLAILNAGEQFNCWQFVNTDHVIPIPESVLRFVKDLTIAVGETNDEKKYYWSTIYRAGQTSAAAFRSAAQTNWNLWLMEKKPATFRGQVFYIEGKLQAIARYEIPGIGQDQLAPDCYRGVLTDAKGNVFAIHFTELPPGVRLGKVRDLQVSFAGYFYKLVTRDRGSPVPLLIGRTVQPVLPIEERLPHATAALLLACQAGPAEATAPLTALALLRATEQLDYWQLYAPKEIPVLRREHLLHVRDRRFFPGISDDEEESAELLAYYDFLTVASRTPVENYAKQARTDVSYAQMIKQPAEFRGDVLHIEGTLKRLSKYEVPRMLQLAGITKLYEAWVFDEDNGSRPFVLMLTELPEGLEPAKVMTVKVSFDAFFFKRGDYAAADLPEGKRRVAPLFVGRTLKVIKKDVNSSALGDNLLYGGMIFLLSTLVGVFGFALWYRRNDQKAQLRLRAARVSEFVPPPQDAVVPLASPVSSTKLPDETDTAIGQHDSPQHSLRPQHEMGGGWSPNDPPQN